MVTQKQDFNLSEKIISNHDMRYALNYLVAEGADINGLIKTQDAKEFIRKINKDIIIFQRL